MLENISFWERLEETIDEENNRINEMNIEAIKSRAVINEMLKEIPHKLSLAIDIEYGVLNGQNMTTAYVQGMETGAQLLCSLLFGSAAEQMLKAKGLLLDADGGKTEVENKAVDNYRNKAGRT